MTKANLVNLPQKIECVRHFLYFPAQACADAACRTLRGHDRRLEVSPSAYNSQWLLLICESYSGERSFDQAQAFFEEVAELFRGEYDGWEFEIRNAIH